MESLLILSNGAIVDRLHLKLYAGTFLRSYSLEYSIDNMNCPINISHTYAYCSHLSENVLYGELERFISTPQISRALVTLPTYSYVRTINSRCNASTYPKPPRRCEKCMIQIASYDTNCRTVYHRTFACIGFLSTVAKMQQFVTTRSSKVAAPPCTCNRASISLNG